ncbi:MAG: sigma-70 family RNA polymerase sigma factor [Clostridiales bacterium]|nr:sigma-70 family RNA polymerase sigma factor [Clostridiales bacterium]
MFGVGKERQALIKYDEFTDTELIRLLRGGDSRVMDYLMEKYKYLVRKKTYALFLFGGDHDDLIQEGMIGLFKAIRDYDEHEGSFFSFAELCISRQIYTAIESAARKKHGPLNTYVSLSSGGDGQSDAPLDGALSANNRDPEQMLIDRENGQDFISRIYDHLSGLERQVLDCHMRGMNYRQIAEEIGKPEKSVDNALQRIRTKVHRLFPSGA